MANSKVETQLAFSDSPLAVPANGERTSDAVTLHADTFDAHVSCEAVNAASPVASDDQIYVFLLASAGDHSEASPAVNDYDTVGHALLLGVLDTNSEATARRTWPIPPGVTAFKLRFDGTVAGTTNTITPSARLVEHRAA